MVLNFAEHTATGVL